MKIIILNKYKEKPIFNNSDYYISTNSIKDTIFDADFFGDLRKIMKISSQSIIDSTDLLGVITNDSYFSFLSNEMKEEDLSFLKNEKVDFFLKEPKEIVIDNKKITFEEEFISFLKYNFLNGTNLTDDDVKKLDSLILRISNVVYSSLDENQKNIFKNSTKLLFDFSFISTEKNFYDFFFWFKYFIAKIELSNEWKELKNWSKIPKSKKKLAEIIFKRILIIYASDKNIQFIN